jgi:deoxyribodipyrimidine photo-lyase
MFQPFFSKLQLTIYSRDLDQLKNPQDLPDVFTTYRKQMEPLRDVPRAVLPAPVKDSLPLFQRADIPKQFSPFTIPDNCEDLLHAILKPITAEPSIKNPPLVPEGAETVHPFSGGEKSAHHRLEHLLKSGAMSTYKETRNGLLGTDFSSKLSAYLAIGCITARQVHASMLDFEDGKNPDWASAKAYGQGENEGTKNMRFELLWRDYMRLCTLKFGTKLFHLAGFKQRSDASTKWSTPDNPKPGCSRDEIEDTLERFLNGTTGMGLIDASQREMYHTGYTSNRARQNVASFFAKHLFMDWRIGAEWYESRLVDYDVSSNWGNWQYVAGVGNDPRDDLRVFNPVKQSFDYDPRGHYIKTWIQELKGLEEPREIFQCWTVAEDERETKGLKGLKMCEAPLKKIEFTVGRKVTQSRGRGSGRARGAGHGRGRGRGGGPGGGRGGGSGADGQNHTQWQHQGRGGYAGRGYGSSRGYYTGQPGYNYGQPGNGGYGGQVGGYASGGPYEYGTHHAIWRASPTSYPQGSGEVALHHGSAISPT